MTTTHTLTAKQMAVLEPLVESVVRPWLSIGAAEEHKERLLTAIGELLAEKDAEVEKLRDLYVGKVLEDSMAANVVPDPDQPNAIFNLRAGLKAQSDAKHAKILVDQLAKRAESTEAERDAALAEVARLRLGAHQWAAQLRNGGGTGHVIADIERALESTPDTGRWVLVERVVEAGKAVREACRVTEGREQWEGQAQWERDILRVERVRDLCVAVDDLIAHEQGR